MSKIRVGVLRGGPSAEYEISLLTGENVLKNIPSDKYEAIDILISKNGQWPEMPAVDVIFNALHGEYGEDGQAQTVLEKMDLPYTGSGIIASALAMDKWASQKLFRQAGLKTPPAIEMEKLFLDSIVKPEFDLPWVVKPAGRGSSVGISLINDEKEFQPALDKAFQYDDLVLTEKFIRGKEITCGILENFNGEKYFALPVVEIVPPSDKTFFDSQCKYDGTSQEICPGRFDEKTALAIQEAAISAHQALGCRDYSRTDMIVAENGIYILEVNTLPGLTKESLFPKAAAAAGCSFDRLLEHLITLALKRKDI
ncbi:MAG: D-alanine--D-alanine ligase [bacterium]|nr:D-alanine--D-alanine ligase [bacterium]